MSIPFREPRISCPDFDKAKEAIDEARSSLDIAGNAIEAARVINSDLREWGECWKQEARVMEREKDTRIEELEQLLAAAREAARAARGERDKLRLELDALTASPT